MTATYIAALLWGALIFSMIPSRRDLEDRREPARLWNVSLSIFAMFWGGANLIAVIVEALK